MPSHDARKALIKRHLLDRFGKLYKADDRTSAVIEEVCRACLQTLPVDDDEAAIEATLAAAGDGIVASHKPAWWPNVGEIVAAVRAEVQDRERRQKAAERDRRIDRDAGRHEPSHKHQWTLQGARERIVRAQAVIDDPASTEFDRWLGGVLLRCAKTAEQRKMGDVG